MSRIALDAMGGDHAPDIPVDAALQALAELSDSHEIVLVGREAEVRRSLERHGGVPERVSVVDAPEVIDMGEKPLAAFRAKPNSSISVALKMQKASEVDAFISGGNTGAVMVASTLTLGLHEGLERPAIAAPFPTGGDPVLVLDAGANVDCSPKELYGFGKIGATYARDVLGRSDPRVGLLNIGEEDEKGNAVVKEAFKLFQRAEGFTFVGNLEGQDILHDKADVVVCDGFVGNILLKFYESAGQFFSDLFLREMTPEVMESEGARRLFKALDYGTYGGGPLLGVRGVSIICHGRSPVHALKNGILVAATAVEHHLSQHIGDQFGHGRGT